ncbi:MULTISPECIES: hypothetical protein [Pseudomonas]|uniref:hypothetical protein n=1 Tax=Pseudomonas TaxID=286 RepID=UPI0013CE6AA5|nr:MULTISPECIES: hypothetical protein [Pseudomonas]MBD8681262.1 hypothetical protein [Pseudomonas sp. CFBP 13719]
MPKLQSKSNQRGFAMISLMISIMVMMALAALAAGTWSAAVYEASAQSTGKYLLTVRGAVISALGRHHEALTLVDTSGAPSGTYPTTPAWAKFSTDKATISVLDLKNDGLLPKDFPNTPPLGRSIMISLSRTPGVCPGSGCEVTAFVYTCWPISKQRTRAAVDVTSCATPPANQNFDGNLVGKAIEAADGFGGSNSNNPAIVNGALFNFSSTDIGIPGGSPGHLVVAASLNSTMFNQFVRQGDSRNVYLNNQLETQGNISSHKGFRSITSYAPGSSCDTNGATGLSTKETVVMCKSGTWFELTSQTVTVARYALNGEAVPAPSCPGQHLIPFTYATLQSADVTLKGTDIDVQGALSGTIRGTGQVSSAGSVSVSGTFTGSANSTTASTIHVAQSADVVNNVLQITPNGLKAKALIIQGCKAF